MRASSVIVKPTASSRSTRAGDARRSLRVPVPVVAQPAIAIAATAGSRLRRTVETVDVLSFTGISSLRWRGRRRVP